MKSFLPIFYLGSLLLISSSLSSFALIPVEKKPISNQQKYLQNKEQHLKNRLLQLQNKSTNTQKRQQKLKKRLYKIQQQQQTKDINNHLLGLLSMIIASAGFVVGVFGVLISLMATFGNTAIALSTIFSLLTLTLAFAVIGLILGIRYFNKRKKNPEGYNRPGYAVIGIIVSGVVLFLGTLVFIAALFLFIF